MNSNAGQQHRMSGSASFEIGDFYRGHKKTVGLRGRAEVTPQLSVEPNISLNWVNLPEGSFTDTVVGGRTTYSITTRSFVAALVQYSSTTRRSQQTCDCGGNISQAARCSSSTPRGAPPFRRTASHSKAAASWSRSIACSDTESSLLPVFAASSPVLQLFSLPHSHRDAKTRRKPSQTRLCAFVSLRLVSEKRTS